jgi:hypothetical protein
MNNGQFGIPGSTNAVFSTAREILWGGDESRIEVLRTSEVIDASAIDAGNTPTNVLRAGLLLGKVTATGKLKQYDEAATDGTQVVFGVLPVELVMVDGLGVPSDRFVPVIVSAPLKSSALLIGGASFIGHPNQAAATVDLKAKFCRLSSELC